MSDKTDILLKLLEIYNTIRLHNENLSRGSVAVVTGASIVLWSTAFGAKTVSSIRLTLLVVSALLPIVGIVLSWKMKQHDRELIVLSNRIRDKHLRALRYNSPEIIPSKWQIYESKDFTRLSWWLLELLVYAILIIFSSVLILEQVRFGLSSSICSLFSL